jgi:hypothetical protein
MVTDEENKMKVHNIQLAQVFNALYQYIRQHGELIKPDHPQMGGIWSAEGVHMLGECKAVMSDGGYGAQIIKAGVFNCFIQYGSLESDVTVNFTVGGPDELRQIAAEITKAKVDMAKKFDIPEDIMNAITALENATVEDARTDAEAAEAHRNAMRVALVNAIKQHIK